MLRMALPALLIAFTLLALPGSAMAGREDDRWRDLPKERRRALEQRHEQFRRMPAEERERVREEYRRFRQLPEEERRALRERWRRLSPEERLDYPRGPRDRVGPR